MMPSQVCFLMQSSPSLRLPKQTFVPLQLKPILEAKTGAVGVSPTAHLREWTLETSPGTTTWAIPFLL